MPGPVELLVLNFPTPVADPAVTRAIADVVDKGDITILDLLFLAREDSGDLLVVDVGPGLDGYGLGELSVEGAALVSEEDLDVVRDALPRDTSAAIIVFEHTWARRLAASVAAAGGEVGLHVRIPSEDVESAVAAAQHDVA
jgi:Family of unknown function (DUF6325)